MTARLRSVLNGLSIAISFAFASTSGSAAYFVGQACESSQRSRGVPPWSITTIATFLRASVGKLTRRRPCDRRPSRYLATSSGQRAFLRSVRMSACSAFSVASSSPRSAAGTSRRAPGRLSVTLTPMIRITAFTS